MVTLEKISWSSYGDYEGPFYRGKHKFLLPENPTFLDKALAVVSATEGCFDSINMYDRCVLSSGVLQFCDAKYFGTTDLLGAAAETDETSVLSALTPALSASGASFKKNDKGKWRFFISSNVEVNTETLQRQLYFDGCSGKKEKWTAAGKHRAKTWAAAVASVWELEAARAVQSSYCKSKLMSFAMPGARALLFESNVPEEPYAMATQAAFISFAVNLPAIANKHALRAAATCASEKWSKQWCLWLLRELTWGPGIAIYPQRYEAIRPVLEREFGVDLPKTAEDLKVPGDHLVVLVHADTRVRESYKTELDKVFTSCTFKIANSPFQGMSAAYTQFARSLADVAGNVLPGFLSKLSALGPRDTFTLATFSAGYAFARALSKQDWEKISCYVAIDSLHAGFESPKVPNNTQLQPFVSFAKLARAGERTCWIGHSDVETPQAGPSAFASTTQSATELVRLAGEPEKGFCVEAYNVREDDTKEHGAALTEWGSLFLARAAARSASSWIEKQQVIAVAIQPVLHLANVVKIAEGPQITHVGSSLGWIGFLWLAIVSVFKAIVGALKRP